MTKADLVYKLVEELEINPSKAKDAVDFFFERVKDALKKGDKVEIRGFGTFRLKKYEGYTGRNPMTGKTVQVKPKRLPVFRTGRDLKERVNQKS